jgi:hypothetical protein
MGVGGQHLVAEPKACFFSKLSHRVDRRTAQTVFTYGKYPQRNEP